MMDNLPPPHADDQIMPNAADGEIAGKLVAGIDRLRGGRQHLHDDDRVRGSDCVGRRARAAIHDGVRLVIGVNLDRHTVAQRFAVHARRCSRAVKRRPDTSLDPDVLDPFRPSQPGRCPRADVARTDLRPSGGIRLG